MALFVNKEGNCFRETTEPLRVEQLLAMGYHEVTEPDVRGTDTPKPRGGRGRNKPDETAPDETAGTESE